MIAVVSGLAIGLALAFVTHGWIALCCARTPALAPRYQHLVGIALVWLAVIVAKCLLADKIYTPGDAAIHEGFAREISELLAAGQFSSALEYFGPGNRGYRFLLGVLYSLTAAPQFCVIALNGCLGFIGSLSMLEVTCRQTEASRAPLWLLGLMCATPSAMFFTTMNLKEGMMLWGCCMILRYTLRFSGSGPRESILLPTLGLLVVGFLRPHIAFALVAAVAAGGMVARRKIAMVVVAGVCFLATHLIVQVYRPELMRNITEVGVMDTMGEFYQKRSDMGGSAIRYEGGAPTPILSGMILLALRPLPSDVFDAQSAALGVEIWAIALAITLGWLTTKGRWRILSSPYVISLLVGVVIISFYFSYMYNMGLMVRQRTQALPLLAALAAVPVLAAMRRSQRVSSPSP